MCSGLFSTGAVGALVPEILGQSINVNTRNSKVINTPLMCLSLDIFMTQFSLELQEF